MGERKLPRKFGYFLLFGPIFLFVNLGISAAHGLGIFSVIAFGLPGVFGVITGIFILATTPKSPRIGDKPHP